MVDSKLPLDQGQATATPAAPRPAAPTLSGLTGSRELRLVLLILLVSTALSIISPQFLDAKNFESIAMGFAMDALIAVGMVIVLIAGQFDVSVGAIMGLAGVVAGVLMRDGVPIWFALIAGLGVATIAGSINGFLVSDAKVSRKTAVLAATALGIFVATTLIFAKWDPLVAVGLSAVAAAVYGSFIAFLVPRVRINALIATLAMMSMCRGLSFTITKGASVGGLPMDVTAIGRGQLLGVATPVIIMLVVVIIGDQLLRRWSWLQQSYYVGTNEMAAKLSGIKTDSVLLAAFTFVAVLAGIAALITVSRFASVTPYLGIGTELRVISACVIGGASLSGGQGSVIGAMLGLALVSVVNNGLVINGVSAYWQEFVSGAILVFAVVFDMLTKRGRARRS